MSEKKLFAQHLDISDPVHWKGFLVVGLIGLAICILAGGIFGIGPAEVLLMKESALGIFLIGDYVLICIGLLQAIRYAFRKGN